MAEAKREPPDDPDDGVVIELQTRAHTPTRIAKLVHDPEVEAWLPRRGKWLGPLTTALAFAVGVVATWLVLNEKGPIQPTKLPPVQEPVAAGGLVPARLEVPPAAVAPVAAPAELPVAPPPAAAAPLEPGTPPPVTLPEGVIPPLPGLAAEPAAAVVAPPAPAPVPAPAPTPAPPVAPVAAAPVAKPVAAAPAPAKAAPAGPIAVDVTSDPPGAAVTGPAGLLGITPLTAVLDGSQTNTLTLTLAGRRPRSVKLTPGMTELHVELPPERAP